MYLKEVRIWNFRQYGEKFDEKPGIIVPLNPKFNILIGENDSGKTAIIDAIRLTLGTVSAENYRISDDDFYNNLEGDSKKEFKIECSFTDLSDKELGVFLEWLSFDTEKKPNLRIVLNARKVQSDFIPDFIEKKITAGPENSDFKLEGLASEILRTTYLKPLRDAKAEMQPGIKSRLAQILQGHEAFNISDGNVHRLEEVMTEANENIKAFFDTPYKEDKTEKTIVKEITTFLEEFFNKASENEKVNTPKFEVSPARLNSILRKLSLELDDKASGLGSLNLLFIAAELLLLDNENLIGPVITLVEEIEAHLHPQAQLRLIKFLQKNLMEKEESQGQFILTTHSTVLAASIELENLILIHNKVAYPMNSKFTKLELEDYNFLQRFLDVTKSNLFFARGVILVEGDAENLLIPAIAEAINRPLHKYGVSIVNIGSTAFKRYAKIFSRSDYWTKELELPFLSLPVSLITDVDIKPISYYKENEVIVYSILNIEDLDEILERCNIEKQEEHEEIVGIIYTTEKKIIKKFKDISLINEEQEKVICEYVQLEMTEDYISKKENEKILKIRGEYESDNSNLRVFVAPKWTLEYSIALSTVKKLLVESIHESRFKEPYSDKNKKKLESLLAEEMIDDNFAYKIFRPLDENLVSKAITAQILAEKILNHKSDIHAKLINDEYLEYLISAIYHVTEPRRDTE